MATKKTTGNNKTKGSGFAGPAIGTIIPKGTKWKKNPDGTMTPIYPNKKK